MQDGRKAVWSIPYVVSVAFFQSLKQNFIAYRSSKVSSRPDCIFEIHQLCQSGFSRVYSNCCCSCLFESEILKIVQSSHEMYSNNILNFQVPTTILNACTKKVWKLIEGTTYIWFFFVWFNGISSLLVINTKPRFNIHIKYIWFVNTFCIYTVKWSNSSISNDPIFLKSTKLNCSTYCYLSLTLQSNTSYLFMNS